jgi:hypothetical protein
MTKDVPVSEPVGRTCGLYGHVEGTGLVEIDLWEPARTPEEIRLGTSFGYGHPQDLATPTAQA